MFSLKISFFWSEKSGFSMVYRGALDAFESAKEAVALLMPLVKDAVGGTAPA